MSDGLNHGVGRPASGTGTIKIGSDLYETTALSEHNERTAFQARSDIKGKTRSSKPRGEHIQRILAA